ncbi:MAG TPA: hypothetical protein VF703_07160 [Pyrinomonadaceae bacterium]|jgi:hypothetical protein
MTTKQLVIRLALLLSCLWPVSVKFVDARAGVLTGGRPILGQKTFRPYGYFSLVGKPPAGFENFDTIQYWRKEDEQTGADISERTSGVNEIGGVVYGYATLSITRRTFVFDTKIVRGVSYKFSGRFLRSDFVGADMNLERPVLVGTLDKYRNGKRTARATVKLSYFAGT